MTPRPAPLPPDLALIRAGDYWRYNLKLRVTCACGRVTTLDSWVIAKKLGAEFRYAEGRLDPLRQKLKCVRCGKKRADLQLVVEP